MGGLVRHNCARSGPSRGGLGACPPRKFLKFRVFLVHSGAILVHTQTLRVRVAAAQKERAPLLEPHLPRRKCTYTLGVCILAYGRLSRLQLQKAINSGGRCPRSLSFRGASAPAAPRFLRQCYTIPISLIFLIQRFFSFSSLPFLCMHA